MIEEDDWRLSFGKPPSFYHQYVWSLKTWKCTRAHWDHDHCEFCKQKISDAEGPDIENEGWSHEQETYWVCSACFEDFREIYQWNLK